jgi:hypothetical protein
LHLQEQYSLYCRFVGARAGLEILREVVISTVTHITHKNVKQVTSIKDSCKVALKTFDVACTMRMMERMLKAAGAESKDEIHIIRICLAADKAAVNQSMLRNCSNTIITEMTTQCLKNE